MLGLMPHPENHIFPHQHPRWTRGESGGSGLPLFMNGVQYATQHRRRPVITPKFQSMLRQPFEQTDLPLPGNLPAKCATVIPCPVSGGCW